MFLFIASYTSYDSKMITELSFCWANKRTKRAPAAPGRARGKGCDIAYYIKGLSELSEFPLFSPLSSAEPRLGVAADKMPSQSAPPHTWLGWAELAHTRVK